MPAVNHTQRTTLSIRKSAVRNLMFYADTGGGEVVFFLETGSVERPRVFYSALMTEQCTGRLGLPQFKGGFVSEPMDAPPDPDADDATVRTGPVGPPSATG